MLRKMIGTIIITGLPFSAATGLADVSAERGATLASEHCTACHDVSADGAFKEYPPSFASIAVYRSREQIKGRMLYPPRHASMPQLAFIMKPAEIDDLVAYIVSLEKDIGD